MLNHPHSTEFSLSWMVNLRNPGPPKKKVNTDRPPSFYEQDMEFMKKRKVKTSRDFKYTGNHVDVK